MCGRFVVSYTYEELLKLLEEDFDLFSMDIDISLPDFNVAPTENVVSIIYDKGQFRAGPISWGYKNSHNHFLINTREETLEIRNSFKNPSLKKCIIPASGFYEWDQSSKDPYYFHKDSLLYFAGIYKQIEKDFYVTIITKEATKDIASIHNRVPVILSSIDAHKYLESKDSKDILNILKEENKIPLQRHLVSKEVNYTKNKSASNIETFNKNTLF